MIMKDTMVKDEAIIMYNKARIWKYEDMILGISTNLHENQM